MGQAGRGLGPLLARLTPLLGKTRSRPARDGWLPALGGVPGDHLSLGSNPLAISMCLRRHGPPLFLDPPALAAPFLTPTRKLVVLAHGRGMNDLWQALPSRKTTPRSCSLRILDRQQQPQLA